MKKNPGGNFGNDFFLEKGIGAYPKNIKNVIFKRWRFFIKFVKGHPFTMLAISKCYYFLNYFFALASMV